MLKEIKGLYFEEQSDITSMVSKSDNPRELQRKLVEQQSGAEGLAELDRLRQAEEKNMEEARKKRGLNK